MAAAFALALTKVDLSTACTYTHDLPPPPLLFVTLLRRLCLPASWNVTSGAWHLGTPGYHPLVGVAWT